MPMFYERRAKMALRFTVMSQFQVETYFITYEHCTETRSVDWGEVIPAGTSILYEMQVRS